MNLRWSLAILAFAACTDVVVQVVGVPIPGPGDGNDKGKGKQNIKESSSTYRANAAANPDQIDQTPGGTWRTTQGAGARGPRPGEHADHMLEAQTVNRALRAQGLEFRNLPSHHQTALREMLNDHTNMQFVQGGVNIRKGGLTSAGLRGEAPSNAHHDRDAYTRQTVAPAVHVANRMDQYLTNAGYQGNVHATHMAAMRSAGVVGQHSPTPMKPGQHQNAVAGPSHSRGSSHSSSSSGPHTPTPMGHQMTLPHHPHPNAGPSTPPNQHPHSHPSVHDVRREQGSHHPPGSHPPSPTPDHHHHDAGHDNHPHTPPRHPSSGPQQPPGAPRKKPRRSNSTNF